MIRLTSCLKYSLLIGFLFLPGCMITPTPIPLSYYEHDYEMSIQVVSIPDKPKMIDSSGSLLGVLANVGRGAEMKKQMEGIKGETVSELLRQNISEKLEDHFDVVEDEGQMVTEIKILQWGWYLPTAFGIKTGSYQLRIMGEVLVFDKLTKRRKQIGYVSIISEKSLGDNPIASVTQEALLQTIDDFADKTVEVILKNKP